MKVFAKILFLIIACCSIASADTQPDICSTKICRTESKNLLKFIDGNVSPCIDFFGAACNSIFKSVKGQNYFSNTAFVQRNIYRELKTYLQNGSDEYMESKLARSFYKSCMQNEGADWQGTHKELIGVERGKSTKYNISNFFRRYKTKDKKLRWLASC